MGKFNKVAKKEVVVAPEVVVKKEIRKTANLAGGIAWTQTLKNEFASVIATSMLNGDNYYEKEDGRMKRILDLSRGLIEKGEAQFLAKSAVYARDKLNLRSIASVLSAIVGEGVKGEQWTKNFFGTVVKRPDDIMETLKCYQLLIGNKSKKIRQIPNSMKVGFGNYISKLSAFSLAKYKKEASEVSLVDLVNLLHPKSNDNLAKLMKGELEVAQTLQTRLTQVGQKAETEEAKAVMKANEWKDALEKNQLGYMAALMNIRNAIEQVPELCGKLFSIISNRELVRKSRVMPFRFIVALKLLESLHEDKQYTDKLKIIVDAQVAVSNALTYSLDNVCDLPGKTLIACDSSGSMTQNYINKSSKHDATIIPSSEIALVLGLVLALKNPNNQMILFDTSVKNVNVDYTGSVWSNFKANIDKIRGGGTSFKIIFDYAQKHGKFDNILILSDMQCWVETMNKKYDEYGQNQNEAWKEYRKEYGEDVNLFSVDLVGYGTSSFKKNVVFLAGFSEKIFDIMAYSLDNMNAMIDEIEKIEFDNTIRRNRKVKKL